MKPGQKMTSNIVLTRDVPRKDETVRAYADRQLVELAQRLNGFRLDHRDDVRLGGLPAVELVFTWNGDRCVIKQRVVFVISPSRQVLSFTLTAEKDHYKEVERIGDLILASIRFPTARPSP